LFPYSVSDWDAIWSTLTTVSCFASCLSWSSSWIES
jgi:hypothetical protein